MDFLAADSSLGTSLLRQRHLMKYGYDLYCTIRIPTHQLLTVGTRDLRQTSYRVAILLQSGERSIIDLNDQLATPSNSTR